MTETKLKVKLKSYLPKRTHFQPIESMTSLGVPDVNFCLDGSEFWVELKIVLGEEKLRFQKPLTPYQWNWLRRRVKSRGNVWIVGQHKKDLLFYNCSKKLAKYSKNRKDLPSDPCYRVTQSELQIVTAIFRQDF